MDFEKPTMQITKINELPRMYENWTDFYKWWHPWVMTTGSQELLIVDYGSGVVTEYRIDWSHELIMAHYEKKLEMPWLPSASKTRTFQWLKAFWLKLSRNSA